MKREFDKYTVFALIFTLWYSLTAFIYISEYFLGVKLVSIVGETIAYPIMLIATLGGLFKGEAHLIIIAWAPILAVIIGVLGWNNRDAECKDFVILPCISLIAPLLMFFLQSTTIFVTLFEVFPVISVCSLIIWVGLDLLMIARDRKV